MSSIVFLILVIGLCGCSSVTRVDFLKANIEDTAWSIRNTEIESYKISTFGVTLYTCPAIVGGDLTSIGVIFLPLIPGPSKPNYEAPPFHFAFAIESLSANTTIDMSKVKVILQDGKMLSPSRLETWQEGNNLSVSCTHLANYKQIPIESVVINDGTIYFGVHFPISISSIEDCVIQLGILTINGKEVEVPQLRYRKASTHKYRPMILPVPS